MTSVLDVRRVLLRAAYAWLYGPGAFSYEAVAAVVSLGEWTAWRRAILHAVVGDRILEIGFGTGRLIPELAPGRVYCGVEPSPWMHRRARSYLSTIQNPIGCRAILLRGRAEALPLAGGIFDTVVATFPTAYIFSERTLGEIARVLRPGGRLLILSEAWPRPGGWTARLAGWLLAQSGTGPPSPLPARLRAAGFALIESEVQLNRSVARLLVATHFVARHRRILPELPSAP